MNCTRMINLIYIPTRPKLKQEQILTDPGYNFGIYSGCALILKKCFSLMVYFESTRFFYWGGGVLGVCLWCPLTHWSVKPARPLFYRFTAACKPHSLYIPHEHEASAFKGPLLIGVYSLCLLCDYFGLIRVNPE